MPTSKISKKDRQRELAVAHNALFAKVQDHAKAGKLYSAYSANYFHIFNGEQHLFAVEIDGNDDIITTLQERIHNGTYNDGKSIDRLLEVIPSRKRHDNRNNANTARQRGWNNRTVELHQGQPTDSQRNQLQSNGDSGSTPQSRRASDGVNTLGKRAKAGKLYYVDSVNYTHIFVGNRHIGAVEINGNEELIKSLEEGIDNGTYQDAADLNRWNESIGSREEYDNRTNAPAQRQRGGNGGFDILHQGQPTDTESNRSQGNGDSGNTTPLRTSSGVVFGFVRNGKIYITARGLNPNTPIHEYTHLWAKALQQKNRKAWQAIIQN